MLGEILLTLGVVVLLYVAWQIWIGDVIYGQTSRAEAQELSAQWAQSAPVAPAPEPTADPETQTVTYEPAAVPRDEDGVPWAIMRVPRWGSDYEIKIAGGVSKPRTLDRTWIGHYLDTEMPGEVGNFGLAAHRTTFGAPFARLPELRVGDPLVIETEAGWYVYRFRNLEYVRPDAYDVLADVPQAPEVAPGERYITLTSCSPKFSMTERIVGYGVFDSFLPRATGETPAALTEGLI